jgi:hypothetical protein
MNTNLKFLALRKFGNLEWETYRDDRSGGYVAICHSKSETVDSQSWDDLWSKIIEKTKMLQKSK